MVVRAVGAPTTLASAIRSHVSSFSHLRYRPPSPTTHGQLSPTMEAAQSASVGACAFVVVVQMFLFLTLWYYERGPTTALLTSSYLFNVSYMYCWRSDPGTVTAPAIDRSAASEALRTEQGLPLRFCQVCECVQPLRSKHCEKCGVCVRKYDHHCFWVGGCVGERNHGRFFAVLLFGTWYIVCALWRLSLCLDLGIRRRILDEPQPPLWSTAARSLVPVILLIIGLLMLLFVGCLLCFHTYLLLYNVTTWESSSGSRITYLQGTNQEHPFDEGWLKNLRLGMCPDTSVPTTWRFTRGTSVPKRERLGGSVENVI